jgi:peptide/nickel transport system ATP-binding protein
MENEPLVEVENLRKLFPVRGGFLDSLLGRKERFLHAVDGVSFHINHGETLGLAGESGCGKTTTGMLLVLLETPTDGTIKYQGTDISTLNKKEQNEFRETVQIIFQDPYESLDPRLRVFDAIMEPLVINHVGSSKAERKNMVHEMLEEVELKPVEMFVDKYPHELSGGQRQRVAIARSMILKPKLIIADEPVSMLDASVKVGIMNLMFRLKEEFDATYLLITHDLSVSRYMCDRIAIMYLGVIVEIGPTEEVISDPRHPYTKMLISSVPVPDPIFNRQRTRNPGEIPIPIDLPQRCRFHSRCTHVEEICAKCEPELQEIGKNHFVACHQLQKDG